MNNLDTQPAPVPELSLGAQAATAPAVTGQGAAGDQAASSPPAETIGKVAEAAAKVVDPSRAPDKRAGKKAVRARRGPPADGGEEARVTVILATSKLTGEDGRRLRRGGAVSVPERRLEQLVRSGKVRRAPVSEVETAERRHGLGRLG